MIEFLEIAATILGIIQGVLIMLNKRINWIFYCLQMVALVLFSYSQKLYGDVCNDTIFFLVGIVAFALWGRGKTRYVSVSTRKHVVVYSVLTIIATCGVCYRLSSTDDPLPFLDAITTVTSILATYLMTMRRIDCWIVWLINDLCYCIEYYLLPDHALYLLALNVIWALMAIGSFWKWLQIYQTDSKCEIYLQ